jgi:hypothetical protein
MEPVYLDKYSSEFAFHLYDYMDGNVLLRNPGGLFMGKETGGNVDLVFLGVEYLEIPALLRGVTIERPHDEHSLLLEGRFLPGSLADPGDQTYAINSEGRRYNIVARNFWVLVCKDSDKESSLDWLFCEDLNKRDAFFQTKVAQWYKIS